MTTVVDRIAHLGPCPDAVYWLHDHKSATQAWKDCKRGDWMLWLIGRLVTSPPWSNGRKKLLSCCLDCAETVKHLWKDKRIAECVAVFRKWIKGKADREQCKGAIYVLFNMHDDHSSAVYNATFAVTLASDAYNAAAYAGYAASYANVSKFATAKYKVLSECADIVRRHYPKPPRV